jgi:hypothetical protein
MNQHINKQFWKEFEEERKNITKTIENRISNSNQKPKTSWMRQICEKIRISQLASERGIEKCPLCNYGISFDDIRGWFICNKAKYDHDCNFKGNIVDLMNFIQTGGLR